MKEVNVKSEITGSVWKIRVATGDTVEQDQELMILESMKMEIPLLSPVAGEILRIEVAEGGNVQEGATTLVIGVS